MRRVKLKARTTVFTPRDFLPRTAARWLGLTLVLVLASTAVVLFVRQETANPPGTVSRDAQHSGTTGTGKPTDGASSAAVPPASPAEGAPSAAGASSLPAASSGAAAAAAAAARVQPSVSPGAAAPAGGAALASSDSNPFANTCAPAVVGFVGRDGKPPKLALAGMPAGATAECRSGPRARLASLAFGSCDGAAGREPVHEIRPALEGSHSTEVRYRVGGATSTPQRIDYYVHQSLDRARCCPPALPDAAWMAAAAERIGTPAAFGSETRLANPFITIALADAKKPAKILSLRRAFRLSEDRRLLLITRTTESRGGRAKKPTSGRECLGLEVSIPRYGELRRRSSCPVRESEYASNAAGHVDPDCPGIFCTVTSCVDRDDGCRVITHTFRRGPGQAPWTVAMPPRCMRGDGRRVTGFDTQRCDAYVLNARGIAACLRQQDGRPRVVAVIGTEANALGLKVLQPQRPNRRVPGRYVFSGKSVEPPDVDGVLYLPP